MPVISLKGPAYPSFTHYGGTIADSDRVLRILLCIGAIFPAKAFSSHCLFISMMAALSASMSVFTWLYVSAARSIRIDPRSNFFIIGSFMELTNMTTYSFSALLLCKACITSLLICCLV